MMEYLNSFGVSSTVICCTQCHPYIQDKGNGLYYLNVNELTTFTRAYIVC